MGSGKTVSSLFSMCSCCDSCFFVTADKEAAVTTHELTRATSTPAHEKERHRDCFDSTNQPYVSRSVCQNLYLQSFESLQIGEL